MFYIKLNKIQPFVRHVSGGMVFITKLFNVSNVKSMIAHFVMKKNVWLVKEEFSPRKTRFPNNKPATLPRPRIFVKPKIAIFVHKKNV